MYIYQYQILPYRRHKVPCGKSRRHHPPQKRATIAFGSWYQLSQLAKERKGEKEKGERNGIKEAK